MIQKCYICNTIYGEKEPLQNKAETHGLCPQCYIAEITRLRQTTGRRRRKTYTPEEEQPGSPTRKKPTR